MDYQDGKTMKRTLFWTDPSIVTQLEQSLNNGLVSITSTDTVIGLLAPLTQQGFDILNIIKGGRSNKPYLVLISSPTKLKHFVQMEHLDSRITKALSQCWPGPLTIVFKARLDLPTYLKSADGTIAVRCPQHSGLLNILQNFDGLFSTSANLSGLPVPETLEQVSPDILKQVDLVVLDDESKINKSVSSTIIDLSGSGQGMNVLREGAFPIAELKRIFDDR